jgi:LysR family hydrogen peroxide-inducible transcriptional activator
VKAAEHCFVTQATLSMMIKKLEDELDLRVFDRSKQPVIPTEQGLKIIEQAKVVLRESNRLKLLSSELKSEVKGELRVGIIPTLAPYLLPLFLPNFAKKYPEVKLHISEFNTDRILSELRRESLDVGIMATPLNAEGMMEWFLFREPFKVFLSEGQRNFKKRYILPEELDVNKLWLLEEGHCFRSQVVNLCELRRQHSLENNLFYEAGSIESLINIVEVNEGLTIVPALAAERFSAERKKGLRDFKSPVPVREVSIVTWRHFIKTALLQALSEEIVQSVRPLLNEKSSGHKLVEIG